MRGMVVGEGGRSSGVLLYDVKLTNDFPLARLNVCKINGFVKYCASSVCASDI